MERSTTFERILALFQSDNVTPAPLPLMDAQHALGALMVRTAKADHVYLFEEIETIDHVLMDAFDLNPVAAAKMRADCEILERNMPRTEDIAHILNYAIEDDQRRQAIWALWRVALADGVTHESEAKVLAQIAGVFGVSSDDSEHLRAGFA